MDLVSKKSLGLMLALMLGALALSATAYALQKKPSSQADHPELQTNLPAAALPTETLPAPARAAFEKIISPAATEHFGITPASFTNVRRLTTLAGPLFIIPGEEGACLLLDYAVACGNPGTSGQPILAVLVKPSSRKMLVGGGIATTSVTSVLIQTQRGHSARVIADDGTFLISPADGFVTADKTSFSVR